MYLNKYEERMLRGDYGDVIAKAMQVIVKVGEVLKADRLVEIETAHIAGVSYLTIGDPGLEYLEDLAGSGARFHVFTTVNPVGIDIANNWGIDEKFVRKQWDIINALRSMGASLWLTCAPYEYMRLRPRTYHAWAESNAVAYINAVYDAWTEKLPGPFMVKVNQDKALDNPLIAGLIGKRIAEVVGDGKPYLIIKSNSNAVIKQLLASYATYSPHALMIIGDLTPNYRNYLSMADKPEVIELDVSEVMKDAVVREGDFDAVFLGCPHYGIEEITAVINYVGGKGWRRATKPVYIATTPFVLKQLDPNIVSKLRESNIHLVISTCPAVSPFLKSVDVNRVSVESVKQMYYLPKMVGINYVSCYGIECLDAVFNG
jgi:hypothetical protein